MGRGRWLFAAFATIMAASPGGAQQPAKSPEAAKAEAAATARDLLSRHTHAISLRDGKLEGPGANLILRLGEQAQFVGIGEEHNNADIPPFVTALFRELHRRAGYNYLADEQDPVASRLASTPPMRGNLGAIQRLARTHKHSFTFNTDEELQMIADIGRLSTGQGRPVWGCEQAFGATHILERLVPMSPSPAARRLAQELLQEASVREAARDAKLENRFLIDPGAAERARQLNSLYAPARSEEARFMAGALARSFEIYGYYLNGQQGVVPGYYSNSAVREEHMKALCRDEYLRAAKLDGRPPRAILKFGHWHLFQTNAPSTVPTLGAFMADVARLNGLDYVSIAFATRSYDGKRLWELDGLKAYAAFAPALEASGWRLIDLRPLREYPAYRAMIASVGPALEQADRDQFRRLVYGFDFLLMLDESRPGRFTVGQRSDVPSP